MSWTALNLTDESISKLLNIFPPKYTKVICHHVTLSMKKLELPDIHEIQVVGYIDGEGTDIFNIEALIVAVQGTTDRHIGGTYHITLSLSEPRIPYDSNKLIAIKEYEKLNTPITITVIPSHNSH